MRHQGRKANQSNRDVQADTGQNQNRSYSNDTEEKYLSNGQTFSERFKNKMREKFKGLPSYPTLKCYLKAYVFKFTFN